ncbi:tetratricopeptide repeat protein [Oryzomonas rubra]|uniref:protein O-GlcNAc transferase n=1 Tax=Oryzomonas rubra TaxID=2509454 RepID=A0A5A9X6I1_9BACT|nr:tetratricopeptide repeat protein [Oryzomonas rubra]KAA0888384.1 tetratricopeptide repeat protein [Oryzomonas rubra]
MPKNNNVTNESPEIALQFHRAGRFIEAEALYQKILTRYPDSAELHKNHGNTLLSLGRFDEAEQAYRQALTLKTDYGVAYNNLGNVLRLTKRLKEAEQAFHQALMLMPGNAEVHNNYGNVLMDFEHFEAAEQVYLKAILLDSNFAMAYCNHGNVLMALGRWQDAEKDYQKSVSLNPNYYEAYSNLGIALRINGHLVEAEQACRQSLVLKPDYCEAYNNLGNVLRDLGRLDEAEAVLRRALEIKPDSAEAHNNLGGTLRNLGRLDEAEAVLRRALEIKPDLAEAHNNLGSTLQDVGRLDEAEAIFRRALEIKPDLVEAHNNLGNIFKDLGRLDEAEVSYRMALNVKPDYFYAYSNLLFNLNYADSYRHSVCLEEALRYGLMVAKKACQRFSSWQCLPKPERLRVGLVSGDLRNHPVGYFLERVLAQIDLSRIELIAYSTCPKVDELTTRIKPLFSIWEPLFGLNDKAAASLIHSDGVHVLLDLSGHTAYNRLPVFAWKPAPVQATWLGYSNTTGVQEIDYILGDPYVTPEEDKVYFSEKLWQLPESYLCLTPPNYKLEVGVLPALSSGFITFGSFNNLSKINDNVVALWARVLHAVPNSHLFLKTKQLNEPAVCKKIKQHFAAQGIGSERLILRGTTVTRAESLAMYQSVDIALDPFPYNGTTTTVEGLWMGVPIITLRGNRYISHVGESITHNAGLTDWIANNVDDYVAKAVEHTRDLNRLATLRNKLRQQVLASPLFDAPRFAKHFEDALYGMWRTYENRAWML